MKTINFDLELTSEKYYKETELKFKENKKNITFQLRGNNKYYYASQCALFEKNLIKYGYNFHVRKENVANKGLYFNKYNISLGHPFGADLKRFQSKEEMLGFVIGYNEAIYNKIS